MKIMRLKIIQVLHLLRWYFLCFVFSLLLKKIYILHNDMTSGQTFENNMKYREMSQGMVKTKNVEYLCMAQRRASHSREVMKKLQKEAKKEQKATELPN